jgi:hypothetical protein
MCFAICVWCISVSADTDDPSIQSSNRHCRSVEIVGSGDLSINSIMRCSLCSRSVDTIDLSMQSFCRPCRFVETFDFSILSICHYCRFVITVDLSILSICFNLCSCIYVYMLVCMCVYMYICVSLCKCVTHERNIFIICEYFYM